MYRSIRNQIGKSKGTSQTTAKQQKKPKCVHLNRVAGSNVENADTLVAAAQVQRCEICVREKRAARKYRWKMLFCLLPAFVVSTMDLTIIATALPFIASHFSK